MAGAVWEFPGSCLVTRMECVGKPQRAGLKPFQIPEVGRRDRQTWRLGGVCAFISIKDLVQ